MSPPLPLRLLLMCCCLALGLPAYADTGPLTFAQALRLAGDNNAELRRARAELEAAEHDVKSARAGYLPQVSGNVTYSDTSGSSAGDASSYSTAITATQNLFAGFQDQARVQRSSAQLESSRAELAEAKATLSRDLKSAFAGLLYAQENVLLTQSILRRLEENLRLVELRFEGGRENKGSYLLTRASVAQARLDHLQAQQALISAQAQFARAIGETATTWQVAGEVPIALPEAAPDFVSLMRATPDYREAVASEQVAEADVRLAKSGFYPSVDLRGSVGRDGESWFPSGDRNSVSATVSIPLFSGGRDYYGVRSALASADAAKASLTSIEQQLLVRLKQAYATYVQAVERVNVEREFLEAAQTRASIARARYQNGLLSFEEWDRIESDLIQRQKTSLTSTRERVVAEAEWELVQGRGVIP